MKRWVKLDNAAKVYPPIRKKNWSAMFRVSCELTEDIDTELLKIAQENILKRFPIFACSLHRGLFWYYLEKNDGAPDILNDIYNPMRKLNPKTNKGFMYRLLYHKKRIAVEIFHAISDGTGGMTFLLSLVNEYIRIKYGESADSTKYILSCDEKPSTEEYEDSFLRYAGNTRFDRNEKSSYHQNGSIAPNDKLLLISAKVSTDELKEKAHKYDATVGEFLSSLLLWSVYKKQQTERSKTKRNQLCKISIPINLRQYFDSKTLRNFSSYLNVGIESGLGDYGFDEIVNAVKHQCKLHINKKELAAKFSSNVAAEKSIFVRLTPLIFKNIIMRFFYNFQGERYFASQISNIGLIDLPDSIGKFITRIDFILGRSPERRCDCAVVSYGGYTYLNFTRTIIETDVERCFLTELVKMGIHVYVESNGRS